MESWLIKMKTNNPIQRKNENFLSHIISFFENLWFEKKINITGLLNVEEIEKYYNARGKNLKPILDSPNPDGGK